jgi:glycerol-3-phosphate dehydrogenase (NAD(P)+)
MQVGVVGLGNVGTAVANLIASNGYDVLGWEYHEPVVQEINDNHTNTKFLGGITLDSRLVATTSIEKVLHGCDVVFLGLPSLYMRRILEPFRGRLRPDTLLVNLAKGVDRETGLTVFQALGEMFPQHRRVMLAGPAIANEFARGMPTVVVIAGERMADLLILARLLDAGHFRTRFSDDPIGVELGGILKNVYTIGLGIFDGKQISSVNFRSVYLTIALEEITRLGVAMGGKPETFAYLAGLGDLLATSLSEHSHNRRMGELLAGGLSLDEVRAEMGVVPEGYNTIQFALALAEKLHITLPLAHGLWDVINSRLTTDRFVAAFAQDFID